MKPNSLQLATTRDSPADSVHEQLAQGQACLESEITVDTAASDLASCISQLACLLATDLRTDARGRDESPGINLVFA